MNNPDKQEFNALVIGACVFIMIGVVIVLGLVKVVEIVKDWF